MVNQARKTVDRMFEAFAAEDVDGLLETVSEDTKWIYHSTQRIPAAEFSGKDGVARFFQSIFDNVEVLEFQPLQFVAEGDTVVVVGREHQRIKRSGKERKQRWVQVYTVENGLISHMEEFAYTTSADERFS